MPLVKLNLSQLWKTASFPVFENFSGFSFDAWSMFHKLGSRVGPNVAISGWRPGKHGKQITSDGDLLAQLFNQLHRSLCHPKLFLRSHWLKQRRAWQESILIGLFWKCPISADCKWTIIAWCLVADYFFFILGHVDFLWSLRTVLCLVSFAVVTLISATHDLVDENMSLSSISHSFHKSIIIWILNNCFFMAEH